MIYIKLSLPCAPLAQVWVSSRILPLTSAFTGSAATLPYPPAFSKLTRLSMNSRLAISCMKWLPPFFTHVSVRLSVASCMLGFLLPIRRFRLRIASLGCTVLLRMVSEISRLSAISSNEEEVARSICASSSLFAAVPNHEDMVAVVFARVEQRMWVGVEVSSRQENEEEPSSSLLRFADDATLGSSSHYDYICKPAAVDVPKVNAWSSNRKGLASPRLLRHGRYFVRQQGIPPHQFILRCVTSD